MSTNDRHGATKVKYLLGCILSNDELFIKCKPLLKAELIASAFGESTEPLEYLEHAFAYFNEHNTLPSWQRMDADLNCKHEIHFNLQDAATCNHDEIVKLLKNFNDNRMIIAGLHKTLGIADKHDGDDCVAKVQSAWTEVFENINQHNPKEITIIGPDSDITKLAELAVSMEESIEKLPCKLTHLDEALGGGFEVNGLHMITAQSGHGKSNMLLNLAFRYINQGHDVIFFSLEMTEHDCWQRYWQIAANIGSKVFETDLELAVSCFKNFLRSEMGNFTVLGMPSMRTSTDDIQAKLNLCRTKGMKPKVILVDYIDLMLPNNADAKENFFTDDQAVAFELKEMAKSSGTAVITASQVNRQGMSAKSGKFSPAYLAGGVSKYFASNNVIGLECNEEHYAENLVFLHMVKTRHAKRTFEPLGFNFNTETLKITDLEPSRELSERLQGILDNVRSQV